VIADRYGLDLSTASRTAADAYIEAVEHILAAAEGADGALDRALAADPGFALAHAARARHLAIHGRATEAREAAARGQTLATGASRREKQHAQAIALAVSGDLPTALEATRAHLADFPRDALVLSQATGVYSLIGFSGRPDRNALLLALLDGLARHYGEDWWFLTVHAFAHTEAGRPREGERLVRRSLDLYPRNAHGAHTLAHALYELGEDDAGASWVSDWLEGYDRAGVLHCHLSWHVALCELRQGRTDRARVIYDDAIRPGASLSPPLGGVADAAAFLWRYGLTGKGIAGLPWREVADHATRSFPRAGNAFVDFHCAVAFAGAGDVEALDRRRSELRELEAAGRQPAGPVVAALVEAVGAFARGDWAAMIALIEPVADQIVRVGGSHAQRDLVEDTLLEAYVHARRPDAAASLLRRRLERRPCPSEAARLAALRTRTDPP
jgi:tetratricopeptide (TPR) repeat protein